MILSHFTEFNRKIQYCLLSPDRYDLIIKRNEHMFYL